MIGPPLIAPDAGARIALPNNPAEAEVHLDGKSLQSIPANIEAEQAILGILLYDNEAYARIDGLLRPIDFFEPFHQRLFALLVARIQAGHIADPVLLSDQLSNDPAYGELGGLHYLADLVDRAPASAAVVDYAQLLSDLALRRELIRVSGEIAAAAEKNVERSALDQVEAAEQQLLGLREDGSVSPSGFVTFSDALRGAVGAVEEAHFYEGGLSGVATGIADLDRLLGRLHPSDLVVLAGRPLGGKLALVGSVAFQVAQKYAFEELVRGQRRTTGGGIVALFSLEVPASQLAMRILADVSAVRFDELRRGDFDAATFNRVRDAAREIQSAPLFIDASSNLTLDKLESRVRRLKRRLGLDLVVIDELRALSPGGAPEGRGAANLARSISRLAALAKELSVTVLAMTKSNDVLISWSDGGGGPDNLPACIARPLDGDFYAFMFDDDIHDLSQEAIIGSIERSADKLVIADIIEAVSEYFDVSVEVLISEGRSQSISRARQIAMWLSKRLTKASLPEIGRSLGGRDHATVIQSIKKIEELKGVDAVVDRDITRILKLLNS